MQRKGEQEKYEEMAYLILLRGNKGKKKRKVILQKDDENYKDGKICKKTSKNIL